MDIFLHIPSYFIPLDTNFAHHLNTCGMRITFFTAVLHLIMMVRCTLRDRVCLSITSYVAAFLLRWDAGLLFI